MFWKFSKCTYICICVYKWSPTSVYLCVQVCALNCISKWILYGSVLRLYWWQHICIHSRTSGIHAYMYMDGCMLIHLVYLNTPSRVMGVRLGFERCCHKLKITISRELQNSKLLEKNELAGNQVVKVQNERTHTYIYNMY